MRSLKALKRDSKADEEGVWHDYAGGRVKLAKAKTPAYQRAVKEAGRKILGDDRSELTDEETDLVELIVFAKAIVKDLDFDDDNVEPQEKNPAPEDGWRYDEEDKVWYKKLVYSFETVYALISDPDYYELYFDWRRLAQMETEAGSVSMKDVEADAGN